MIKMSIYENSFKRIITEVYTSFCFFLKNIYEATLTGQLRLQPSWQFITFEVGINQLHRPWCEKSSGIEIWIESPLVEFL